MSGLVGLWAHTAEEQRSLAQRQTAQILARAQALTLERQLQRSLSATLPLAEIIRRTGTVTEFDRLAAEIIRSYGGIACLELVPQNGVRQIYPHPGNKSAMGLILPDRMALQAFTLYPLPSPVPDRLSSPNLRVVGRWPLILGAPARPRKLWGVVSVQIRLDLLLHAAQMQVLGFNGYDYELSYLDATTQKRVVFTGSAVTALVNPITSPIAVPNGSWILAIAPQGGWQTSPQLARDALLALIISMALSGGVWRQQRDRHRYHQAITQAQQAQTALHSHITDIEPRLQQTQQDLNTALTHLATTQQDLSNTKKLATLGYVMAGIAHDINTPLAAIRAANANLINTLIIALPQLPPILQSLDASQSRCFFALIQSTRQPADPTPAPASSRQRRQWRQAIAQQLHAQQFSAHALDLADTLVDLGITQDIQPYTPILTAPNARQILRLALALQQLQHQSQTIGIAVAHVAKIVFAVKSYSHGAPAATPKVPTYIPDHLEIILTLYAHQLKQSIIVERYYDPLPPILCYPDELSQVWTNLIHNAIQAMSHRGYLTLHVTRQSSERLPQDCSTAGVSLDQVPGHDDFIVVSITDSGPGIPPEILPHIFDPFFTTKPVGEGSGLGLDISAKIVHKHQGQIAVQSQPGKTTFQVWLPMLQMAE